MRFEPQTVEIDFWLFDRARKKLIMLFDSGNHIEWDATSGPYGQGEIPAGAYVIGKPVAIDAGAPENRPYKDDSDFAWWCPITPMYGGCTFVGLGIHPDGNVPGTQGCVGIDPTIDTGKVFQALGDQPRKVLWVV